MYTISIEKTPLGKNVSLLFIVLAKQFHIIRTIDWYPFEVQKEKDTFTTTRFH